MKRIIFLVVILSFPLFIAQGQIQIGAKGGINIANWVDHGPLAQGVEWNALVTPTGGVFGTYKFNKILGIQIEANYIQK